MPELRISTAKVEEFIEAAREVECDEDKERFEAKMKRIAKARVRDKKHEAPKS